MSFIVAYNNYRFQKVRLKKEVPLHSDVFFTITEVKNNDITLKFGMRFVLYVFLTYIPF